MKILSLNEVELLPHSLNNKVMTDLTEAIANREAIKAIKQLYDSGKISREEAMELAQPIIRRVNARAEVIAKTYKVQPHRLDFSSLMRNSY